MALLIQIAAHLTAKDPVQVDILELREDNAVIQMVPVTQLLHMKLNALLIFLHTIMIPLNATMGGSPKIHRVAVLMVLVVTTFYSLRVAYVEC